MQLFNKHNNGSQELVQVLGLIDDDLPFSKWAPIIPLGIRDLKAIVGADVITELDNFYQHCDDPDFNSASAAVPDGSPSVPSPTVPDGSPSVPSSPLPAMHEAVRLAQQAAAMFTWLKVIPTLDAQHSASGRAKRLGENEHGMTAAQEFKDEDNIRAMAFQATDALIAHLDDCQFLWWMESERKKRIAQLLIPSKEIFDEYYVIGSHRLFLTLVPMIRETQESDIIPIITRARFDLLLQGDETLCSILLDAARRPLALLTMVKAVERLPIEVLPEGIVQVQQSQTIRDKLKAEREARQAVATSLSADAARYLQKLADIITELDAQSATPDYHVPSPTLQSRGITF